MNRCRLLNTEVDNLTMSEALKCIDNLIKENANTYVVTPNINHVVMLERDEEFRRVYNEAGLILTDGKPLIWISRLKKNPIKEKISGSDLFPRICYMAAKKGYKVYLLGAAEGVAKEAARRMCCKYKGLNIVGTYSPPSGFENNDTEIKYITDVVNTAKPDILIVALGSPKGEKFIYHHYKELNVPITFQLGAAIDFAAGNIKRAPRWMSNCGLEWLYRIIQEPNRLLKRYAYDAFAMIGVLWKYR